MSVGSPNSLKSPTESKPFDSSHMNGQRGKPNGDLEEPVPAQRKSTMKKLVGGVAVLPTLTRKPIGRDDEKENKTSPVFYDHEPSRRTVPEQPELADRIEQVNISLLYFVLRFCKSLFGTKSF